MSRMSRMPAAIAALMLAGASPAQQPPSPQPQSPTPTPAPTPQVSLDTGTVADAVARLKPGEFLWVPEVAPKGPMLLIVNITTQRAVLYRNGVPIGISTASTGRASHPTPTGVFTVLEKQVFHRSSKYNNAPMPFMQRLTWYGVALHAGNLPGYPASHGCIRLPAEFARDLYALTWVGMTVVITRAPSAPHLTPGNDPLRAPAPAQTPSPGEPTPVPVPAPAPPQPYDWAPEQSPAGPVSIVVSGADGRVVVLRNGRPIGSAPVRFDAPITRTSAYSLQADGGEGLRWVRLPLPGQKADEPVTPGEWRGFHVPEGFRQAVRGIAEPGMTVVVTADTLKASATGKPVTVISGK